MCVQAPAGPRPPRQHRATASAGRGTNKYQQTRRETATHERERPKGHPRAWESAQRPPRACSAALSTFGRALCYLRVGPQQRASRPPKRRFLVRRLQPPSSPESSPAHPAFNQHRVYGERLPPPRAPGALSVLRTTPKQCRRVPFEVAPSTSKRRRRAAPAAISASRARGPQGSKGRRGQ